VFKSSRPANQQVNLKRT